MEVTNSIVHYIDKSQGADKSVLYLRDQELSRNSQLEMILEEIHQVFHGKIDKGYGRFIPSEDGLSVNLKSFVREESDFVEFSKQAMQLLKNALDHEPLATGGHVILYRYQQNETEFMLVAILHHNKGVAVNSALELNPTQYLDVQKLHLAVKIDLTEWQNNPNSTHYITFAKGRSAAKITEYFKKFIGCEETINTKEETETFIRNFDEYCKSSDIEPEQINDCSEQLYDYCLERAHSGEEIEVGEISRLFDNPNLQNFVGIETNQQLLPDARALKPLVKLSGKVGGLSITFQKKLLGQSIFYDPDTSALTITTLPESLKEQLDGYSQLMRAKVTINN